MIFCSSWFQISWHAATEPRSLRFIYSLCSFSSSFCPTELINAVRNDCRCELHRSWKTRSILVCQLRCQSCVHGWTEFHTDGALVHLLSIVWFSFISPPLSIRAFYFPLICISSSTVGKFFHVLQIFELRKNAFKEIRLCNILGQHVICICWRHTWKMNTICSWCFVIWSKALQVRAEMKPIIVRFSHNRC